MKLNLFTKIAIVFALAGLLTNLISSLTITSAIENSFVGYHEDNQTSLIDLTLQNFEQFNQENIHIIADYSTNIPLNSYLTTAREFSDQELFKIIYDIEQSLDNSYNNISHRNIFIKGINGQIYTDDTAVVLANSEQIDNSYITKASLENPEKIIYTYGVSGFYNNNNSIVAVKQLPQAYSFNSIGTIYIDIEESTIKSLYSDYISDSTDTYIIDTNGNVISSNVKNDISTQNTELLNIATEINATATNLYFLPEIHEGHYKYFSAYIPVFDMYIVNKVDLNQALSSYYDASASARFSAILVVLAGIAIVFLITKNMSDPLNLIIKRIASTKKGNLKPINTTATSTLIGSTPEVLELVSAYNLMIDEIDGYTKELLETEKQKRFAELSALQMQINPHFLYNTLAVIKYLVWQGEKEKAAKTIESLIDLLQNTISKNDEMISFSQEIENLKNYIYK